MCWKEEPEYQEIHREFPIILGFSTSKECIVIFATKKQVGKSDMFDTGGP